MSYMNAVDTNVLMYVHDPRDPRKQAIADSLVHSLPDGVLLWQVACEFIAASRKLAPYGFSQADAWQAINLLQALWTTKLPRWSVWQKAEALQASYSLSI
jgi:predicted nucleic acid-binding protein